MVGGSFMVGSPRESQEGPFLLPKPRPWRCGSHSAALPAWAVGASNFILYHSCFMLYYVILNYIKVYMIFYVNSI